MKSSALKKILDDISKVKIAIVGDFCLDAYWFIDEKSSEISIETNLPTHPVSEQRYSLGGAGNVASNLAAMGVKDIRVFGVIGTDPFGNEMACIMRRSGIDTSNLLVQEKNWHTHTYSKPYIGSSELSRIDFGNFNSLHEQTADSLIGNLEKMIPETDAIIINQQVPSGIHTEYFRKSLIRTIARFPGKLFITDSRNYNDLYDGTVRKMNDTEALRLCGVLKDPSESISISELKPFAEQLSVKYRKPLFITRGAKGSIVAGNNSITEIAGLHIISKVDTVGAGDSYLAGAAAALAAGYSITEAAQLGTLVAGVTVQKLFQTGTASPGEILAIGSDPDLVYSPDLAENIRHAVYFEGTDIEIIKRPLAGNNIRHAIFDHDGTVSTLRQGWEQIMAPMMIRSILGSRYDKASDSEYAEISARVNEFIDKTTGIQTLAQMHGLGKMVREYGYVPSEEIKDAQGYKRIFNAELLMMVRRREKKLRCGELSVGDLTIKNSVEFLKVLHEAGITLWLASGTDEDDVRNEAEALGYAGLFEGKICGSTGDITNDAKKVVLDRILDDIGETMANRVITFGDGPVEIRETKKRGGITVGIASNEIRRYGLNVHKRTRLVKAGADIIIPDFSQYRSLIELILK